MLRERIETVFPNPGSYGESKLNLRPYDWIFFDEWADPGAGIFLPADSYEIAESIEEGMDIPEYLLVDRNREVFRRLLWIYREPYFHLSDHDASKAIARSELSISQGHLDFCGIPFSTATDTMPTLLALLAKSPARSCYSFTHYNRRSRFDLVAAETLRRGLKKEYPELDGFTSSVITLEKKKRTGRATTLALCLVVVKYHNCQIVPLFHETYSGKTDISGCMVKSTIAINKNEPFDPDRFVEEFSAIVLS